MSTDDDIEVKQEEEPPVESCVQGMTRKEFLRTLVKKSLAAGALFAAISALEQYDIPPAYGVTAVGT